MLCRSFGISRQSHYKSLRSSQHRAVEADFIIQLVQEIRKELPALGTRKLYYLLVPRLAEHGIKMGRDALFNLLRQRGLLIRKRKNGTRTTFSYRWFNRYNNLIKNWSPTTPGQLWVSDITYIRM